MVNESNELITELNKTIKNINDTINELRLENKELKDALLKNINKDFLNDEEELSRETDWILAKRRPAKKRRAHTSPEIVSPTKPAPAEKVVVPIQKKKELPPPPINLVGVNSYNDVKTVIEPFKEKGIKMVALNNNKWKLNVPDSDCYRSLAHNLDAKKVEWYTYEDKATRPTKVMVRGLHPTCTKEEIIEDLKERGYNILDATNILIKKKMEDKHGNTSTEKVGIPLFMLTFSREETPEKIYEIKDILNIKIKMVPYKANNQRIPQCKRCQGFNHTANYCHQEARCVKCAGHHKSQSCAKLRDTPPQCVNCGEKHPASYRGCEVAVELQKIRNKLIAKEPYQKTESTKSANKNVRVQIPIKEPYNTKSNTVKPGVSYANILKQKNSNVHQQDQQQNVNLDVKNGLQQIAEQLKKMNEKLYEHDELLKTVTSNFGKLGSYLDTKDSWKKYIKSLTK